MIKGYSDKELIQQIKLDNSKAFKSLHNRYAGKMFLYAFNIIKNNIHSNLSIKNFAVLRNMSLSSFKRKFNKVYSESPNKYIKRMKLEKATKLLLNTDLLISEIAYECNFDTISSFNRSFKLQFKVSPTEYRLN